MDIVRHGTTPEGKQRYRCRACPDRGRTFLLEYAYAGRSPEVKQQMVDMAMNASGIRDTARVLHVSPTTVLTFRANFRAKMGIALSLWDEQKDDCYPRTSRRHTGYHRAPQENACG